MFIKGLAKVISLFSLKADLFVKCCDFPHATVMLENENSIELNGVIPFHKIHNASLTSSFNSINFKEYLNNLVHTVTIDNFETDISKIDGLSSSKDACDFDKFKTIAQFAEKTCQNLIEQIDMANLTYTLSHERNLLNNTDLSIDLEELHIYSWQNKIYWKNGGGSHHFAAAQYLANKMNVLVKVVGELQIQYLDSNAVANFNNRFDAFMLPVSFFNALESMNSDLCKGLVTEQAFIDLTKLLEVLNIPFATVLFTSEYFKNIYVLENGTKLSDIQLLLIPKNGINHFILKQLELRFKSFNSVLSHQINIQRGNKVLTTALKATATKVRL